MLVFLPFRLSSLPSFYNSFLIFHRILILPAPSGSSFSTFRSKQLTVIDLKRHDEIKNAHSFTAIPPHTSICYAQTQVWLVLVFWYIFPPGQHIQSHCSEPSRYWDVLGKLPPPLNAADVRQTRELHFATRAFHDQSVLLHTLNLCPQKHNQITSRASSVAGKMRVMFESQYQEQQLFSSTACPDSSRLRSNDKQSFLGTWPCTLSSRFKLPWAITCRLFLLSILEVRNLRVNGRNIQNTTQSDKLQHN